MSSCAVVPTVSFIRAGQHVAEPDNLGGAFLRALRLRRQLRPCRGTLRLLVSSIRWPDEDTGDAIGGRLIRVAGWYVCLGGCVDGGGRSTTVRSGFRNCG